MVTKFATGDFNIIHGVLITASSIFEKYSIDMKSQKLWEEIKFVLDNFAKPFTDLLNATMNLAKEHAQNPAALKVIFGSLHLIAKIFYFLNYQDLPEFFEDNMQAWMTHFLSLLEVRLFLSGYYIFFVKSQYSVLSFSHLMFFFLFVKIQFHNFYRLTTNVWYLTTTMSLDFWKTWNHKFVTILVIFPNHFLTFPACF